MLTIFEHKECFEHVEGSAHKAVSFSLFLTCCEAKREGKKHDNIQVFLCCFKVLFGRGGGNWVAVDKSGYKGTLWSIYLASVVSWFAFGFAFRIFFRWAMFAGSTDFLSTFINLS